MNAVEQGRRLAERHRDSAELDPTPELDQVRCLLNYAEVPYEGDWTLRSGLMRLAQPHPALVGIVLESSRRLDATLHQARKALERHVVVGDHSLDVETLAGPPVAPCPDIRTADLARLVAAGSDEADLLAGYEETSELGPEERLAVPLLAVAVAFEQLAETVTAWALVGPADPPPVETISGAMDRIKARLDELGVPVETGPPPGARRGSRG